MSSPARCFYPRLPLMQFANLALSGLITLLGAPLLGRTLWPAINVILAQHQCNSNARWWHHYRHIAQMPHTNGRCGSASHTGNNELCSVRVR